ncbi:MAG: magnesium-translocating P-type ATPase [Sulfuriferula sp.]|nr:magnesium-translocating P-type ATPase [Sulfuriferula sp.]
MALFSTFIRLTRPRRLHRLFRRLTLLGSVVATGVNKEVPPSLAHTLNHAARTDTPTLLASMHAHPEGLTDNEAAAIRIHAGHNEIEQEKPPSAWLHIWHSYRNPFNLLLTLLALVSYVTGDMKATIVISSMIILSTVLRFWQESKSNQAADKLKAMVSNTATVLRRNLVAPAPISPAKRTEIPIKQLVPGDITLLSAGDMIPADCRVLFAKDLFISQSAMTGESLPVEKYAQLSTPTINNPLDLDNILFMGTNVISGSATALVITTGKHTYFGALAERVVSIDRAPTAFQQGVSRVSWLLIRFMFIMVPIVFLLNGYTKGDWLEAMLFAISVAVGLTPEMLPMIVTSTLAKGAVKLSQQKVIVKRLDAIQNFGAMDVLCTDKTGTLTQDKIVLAQHIDVHGAVSADVLTYAYLNSYYQTGLKNLLDVAVLENVAIAHNLQITQQYRKIDEIPFDFHRRRMSVVVSARDDHHELICKGAIEEILNICTHVQQGDEQHSITPAILADIAQLTTKMNSDGLRVVAVAVKATPTTQDNYSLADETELTLIGFIAFLDPPKESTAPALAALKAHGIHVKVLTGDNELVTRKVCHDVGLPITGVLLGTQIETMSDVQLAQAVEQNNLYAKLSPIHKERIVRALKANGHVVGFMGDGINDAPALHAADIGISVDSAVDIAKEAADIILLERSLMVLEQGVIEGRKTFINMLKYIKMTASSNFGNVFSVLIASAFLPFLPMLPLHLLVQNLLYDFSQIAIPFDNVDEELLKQPQHWQPNEISRFMLFFGPISSIFDVTTFALLWFVFSTNSPEHQTLFQSGWFIEGLLSQTLIVQMIRTRKIPFIQSRPSGLLLFMSSAVVAIGLFIVMGPIAHYFKLQALPLSYFPYLIAILLSYMGLTQLMKSYYTRRYGWQ